MTGKIPDDVLRLAEEWDAGWLQMIGQGISIDDALGIHAQIMNNVFARERLQEVRRETGCLRSAALAALCLHDGDHEKAVEWIRSMPSINRGEVWQSDKPGLREAWAAIERHSQRRHYAQTCESDVL